MINIFANIFGDMFESYQVIFEIYVEDKLTNKQTMQAPKEMLIANFLQTVKQISNDKRPIKIKMIYPEVIWDRFENKEKTLNNEVEYSNDAMILWKESKQEEEK